MTDATSSAGSFHDAEGSIASAADKGANTSAWTISVPDKLDHESGQRIIRFDGRITRSGADGTVYEVMLDSSDCSAVKAALTHTAENLPTPVSIKRDKRSKAIRTALSKSYTDTVKSLLRDAESRKGTPLEDGQEGFSITFTISDPLNREKDMQVFIENTKVTDWCWPREPALRSADDRVTFDYPQFLWSPTYGAKKLPRIDDGISQLNDYLATAAEAGADIHQCTALVSTKVKQVIENWATTGEWAIPVDYKEESVDEMLSKNITSKLTVGSKSAKGPKGSKKVPRMVGKYAFVASPVDPEDLSKGTVVTYDIPRSFMSAQKGPQRLHSILQDLADRTEFLQTLGVNDAVPTIAMSLIKSAEDSRRVAGDSLRKKLEPNYESERSESEEEEKNTSLHPNDHQRRRGKGKSGAQSPGRGGKGRPKSNASSSKTATTAATSMAALQLKDGGEKNKQNSTEKWMEGAEGSEWAKVMWTVECPKDVGAAPQTVDEGLFLLTDPSGADDQPPMYLRLVQELYAIKTIPDTSTSSQATRTTSSAK